MNEHNDNPAPGFNVETWANNFADRMTRITWEARDTHLDELAKLKNWMELRLENMERKLSEEHLEMEQKMFALATRLNEGISKMEQNFEDTGAQNIRSRVETKKDIQELGQDTRKHLQELSRQIIEYTRKGEPLPTWLANDLEATVAA